MAKLPEKKGEKSDQPDISEECATRLKEARAQKSLAAPDIREVYFFVRPRLSDHISSESAASKQRNSEDADDLATGIGSELAEDFATEVLAAFFPEDVSWVQTEVIFENDDEKDDELIDQVRSRDDKIFGKIKESNFYAEMPQVIDPDLTHGTGVLWITDPGGGLPYQVEHVPIREIELNVGPNGDIDDCFRVRHVDVRKVGAVLPNITLPESARQKKQGTLEIVWGYWRDWSDALNFKYYFCLTVDGKQVEQKVLEGEGSLPIVAMRMSPDKLHSFGMGPGIKGLQEFRLLDVISAATTDRIDIAVAPPFGFPGDGVTDFENGIESGKAYPMRPGAGRDVVPLYFEGNPDLGFYTAKELEHRLRRKFFADYPEQTGDTPPSATQWIDQMAMAQRRIGTPGAKFFREGPLGIFKRFMYLMLKGGLIENIEVDGQSVALVPNNPAIMARDSQKVQVGMQLMQAAKSAFPLTAQAAIDEYKTINNMKRLLRDKMVVLRDEKVAMDMVQNLMESMQEGDGGEA